LRDAFIGALTKVLITMSKARSLVDAKQKSRVRARPPSSALRSGARWRAWAYRPGLEALTEAGVDPDGSPVFIGAINGALIAGASPGKKRRQVERVLGNGSRKPYCD